MRQNEADQGRSDFNRREFIRGATSFGSLMALMGGIPLDARAEDNANAPVKETHYTHETPPVSCAVIGCGAWGLDIIQTLALMPSSPIVAVCDPYKRSLGKARDFAPKAQACDDYRKLLEQKDVEAVIVATPSHLHREIVVAALQAGKHVYCEAPLASSIEDARAIAQAAKAALKVNFQTGLQMRADPGKKFVLDFVRSGAVGAPVMARSQWHKRNSWRRPGTTPERDKALNWRLDAATSAGLVGEIGVHQLDLMNWMLAKKPIAVTGFGSILDPDLQDGRDVADTIQTVMHYPKKVNAFFDCSLTNSFDGEYDVLYGTAGAILFRPEFRGEQYSPSRAWLFEETDAKVQGWEIYAAKTKFYCDTGISLVADASKSVQPGKHVEESPYKESTLQHSLKAFIINSDLTRTTVGNFLEDHNGETEGLAEELAAKAKFRKPAAGYQIGFEATVTAIKANEAIVQNQKIALPPELFEI